MGELGKTSVSFRRSKVKSVWVKSILIVFLLIILGGVCYFCLGKKGSIEKIVEEMSLEEKVGQLFIFGFWGTEPDYYITKMINERHIGGVILMGYNIEDRVQLSDLTGDLQLMSVYPLFISIDQEGGVVSRIQFEDSNLVAQGEITKPNQAFSVALERGLELKSLGINLNFSPVLDRISDESSFLYDRVFRGNSNTVSGLSIEMVKGYSNANVLSCIKHFPGHNNSSINSHEDLPSVDIEESDLEGYALQFREVLNESNAVMIGHIIFPKIDSENPASLSSYFLKDILREKYGFQGLIITDDMQMGSIYDRYDLSEVAVKAISAGNDILVYTGEPEEQAEAYNAVLEAVRNGDISESEINDKVYRILSIKTIYLEEDN
jgi:beta-N-acetylhexosaminidase